MRAVAAPGAVTGTAVAAAIAFVGLAADQPTSVPFALVAAAFVGGAGAGAGAAGGV
jgi:hypothetical protein